MEKRIKTGIKGFDKLIEGGFPHNSNILISGEAGTGKSIFSIEYLINGAKNNEYGIYFTFEEKKNSIIEQAKQFNYDLEQLEINNKLKIISIGTQDISKTLIEDMIEIIINLKAKRVVIDSITTMSYLVSQTEISELIIKNLIFKFLTKLREITNLTSLIISQQNEQTINNLCEYLCDGVIKIEHESLGENYDRHLFIKKMRRTNNCHDIHPLEISKIGIQIHNLI